MVAKGDKGVKAAGRALHQPNCATGSRPWGLTQPTSKDCHVADSVGSSQ